MEEDEEKEKEKEREKGEERVWYLAKVESDRQCH